MLNTLKLPIPLYESRRTFPSKLLPSASVPLTPFSKAEPCPILPTSIFNPNKKLDFLYKLSAKQIALAHIIVCSNAISTVLQSKSSMLPYICNCYRRWCYCNIVRGSRSGDPIVPFSCCSRLRSMVTC